jgi:general nucleoside transport system permease protein
VANPNSSPSFFKKFSPALVPIFSILASTVVGCGLILINHRDPWSSYANLLKAAFGFSGFNVHSAIFTTLQFTTPILLSGLSAMIAFRAKFISLGQFGQMVFGASISAFIGSRIHLSEGLHPIIALTGAAVAGGLWGLLPALLKVYLNVNEILTTIFLNPIAVLLVGLIRSSMIADTAQLPLLIAGTRLSIGFLLALFLALLSFIYFKFSTIGYEHRMSGEASAFSIYGGISASIPILRGMFLSGAVAGLAGGIEILGVHHHFVSSFSAISEFDGLIVALLGMLNPFGVVLASIYLGGLRAGALVGLQIESGVPRELGGLLIAFTILILANERFFKDLIKSFIRIFQNLTQTKHRSIKQ